MRSSLVEALLLILVIPSVAVAHQDTIFSISSDGSIQGIPEEYGPASIDVVYGEKPWFGKARPNVTVTIGDHVTELSRCIAGLFMRPPKQPLRAFGSWYHNFDLLPPYLVIAIPHWTRSSDSWPFDGYSLMFDLQTGDLIMIRRHETDPEGTSEWVGSISESEACRDDGFPSPPE